MKRFLSIFLCFILLNFLFIDSIMLAVKKNVEKEYTVANSETEEDNGSGRLCEEEFIISSALKLKEEREGVIFNFYFGRKLSEVYIAFHCPPPNC